MTHWRSAATVALLVATVLATGSGSSAAGSSADLRLVARGHPGYDQPLAFLLEAPAVRDLYPGAVRPIRLTAGNPYPFALRITELRGIVVGTSDRRCGTGNVVVRPYAGTLPLTVAARQRVTAGTLPLQMRPDAEQACAGVTFRIRLTGTAQRVGR